MEEAPVVLTELEVNQGWTRDGGLILAMLLVTSEPYKVHLRTSAIAIEQLRNDPQACEPLFEAIENLIAEFRVQVRAKAA